MLNTSEAAALLACALAGFNKFRACPVLIGTALTDFSVLLPSSSEPVLISVVTVLRYT